jgi:hypothetical protein
LILKEIKFTVTLLDEIVHLKIISLESVYMTEDIEKGFTASHLISKLSKQTKIRG